MFRVAISGGVNKSLCSASPTESTDNPNEFWLKSDRLKPTTPSACLGIWDDSEGSDAGTLSRNSMDSSTMSSPHKLVIESPIFFIPTSIDVGIV
mmetsp:Transcript_14218/g.23348  ORF Transcript_14218/g.23348 Transcript_14218/m.23348 type:complete len:94 (+) Transcript_14218:205-486(+)